MQSKDSLIIHSFHLKHVKAVF